MGRARAARLRSVKPGPDTKQCSYCTGHYPATLEYFGPAKTKSGLHSHCRNCTRQRRRQTYHQYGGKETAKKHAQSKAGKYQAYRNGAKQRGLTWEMSRRRFDKLWRQPCHYCGAEIGTIGIDRIDSSKGYSADNIVPCCSECNTAKMGRTAADYIAHCRRVSQHSATKADEVK